jgi:hypothetical protein
MTFTSTSTSPPWPIVNYQLTTINWQLTTTNHSTFGVRTALSAEWEPADGSKWVEKDFAAEITKLEKEAEERLDEKIEELKGNVANVGKP